MRVLITGGAGFIGSHLAEASSRAATRSSSSTTSRRGALTTSSHSENIRGSTTPSRASTTQPVVAELVDQCDVVFHLAAAVGVKLIVESPVRTIETNVHGTEVVLAQADKKKKKVLVASTSEVYGLSNQVPFREDGNLVMGATTKGRWSYACSKAIDEFLALAYWREKRLPTIVVRLFNTVGPRQTGQYGMVDPDLRQARRWRAGRSRVYGDGTQSRCFTHVGDVVGALIALMDHPGAVGEVFNIGSTEEVTIAALAERVKEPVRLARPRSCSCPTRRPTKRASRTCPGACPTSRRSRRRSATGRPGRSTRSSRASSPRAAIDTGASTRRTTSSTSGETSRPHPLAYWTPSISPDRRIRSAAPPAARPAGPGRRQAGRRYPRTARACVRSARAAECSTGCSRPLVPPPCGRPA